MSNGAFRVTAARADIACGAPPEGTFRRRRAALTPCSTPPLPSLPGRASCEWGESLASERAHALRSGRGSGDEIAVKRGDRRG